MLNREGVHFRPKVDEDWWKGLRSTLKGVSTQSEPSFLGLRCMPFFLNANTGLATWHSIPGLPSYSSSKIASAKLFEHPQVEHPDLRVVNVHPGVVEMAMTEKIRVTANDDRKFCGNETWTLY